MSKDKKNSKKEPDLEHRPMPGEQAINNAAAHANVVILRFLAGGLNAAQRGELVRRPDNAGNVLLPMDAGDGHNEDFSEELDDDLCGVEKSEEKEDDFSSESASNKRKREVPQGNTSIYGNSSKSPKQGEDDEENNNYTNGFGKKSSHS